MSALDPVVEDAFGHALLARLRGEPGLPIIERDDGFVEADQSDYLAPVSDGDELWPWIRPRLGQQVVDIGAGAGRASVDLQEEGRHVLALDVSPGALEVCRQRGIAKTFLGTVPDLADSTDAHFDTFLCLGANLGLIGRQETASAFFEALDRLSTSDVRLVGTMLNPYVTDLPAHLRYHDANRVAGRPAGSVRLRVRYRSASTPWFELLWASPDELADVGRSVGWSLVDVYESGTAYAAELRPA